MFSCDYLLAVALLTAPVDTPEFTAAPAIRAQLLPALKAVALQWELLDPREDLLKQPDDLAADLTMLRRRHQELAGAPHVEDCNRFPDRSTVGDLLAFNRTYRQHLEARQALDQARWWELNEALQETDQLYQVWDNVRDARCDFYHVTMRRHALKRLRDLIGPEAYGCGCLPPHVPIWRFQQID
jgi:hypothetical protein